jgi:pimeloyl-ACP methyl ester carboxylesterase
MTSSPIRTRLRFASGDAQCVAWHYPGSNGACVVMAGGFGVTKEPGTDPFAKRFHQAGFSVLAFDHRGVGESDGSPRQVASVRNPLTDGRAAFAAAQRLPEVDPERVALWGFSTAGGHVVRVAAGRPEVAAVIAQTPNVDGPRAAMGAARYQSPPAMVRLLATGLLDTVGGLFGAAPRLVPLSGEPGTVALLTTPDGVKSDIALNPGNRYPEWRQEMAARSMLSLPAYRPVRYAGRVQCPLLVVAADEDRAALAGPGHDVARRAPYGELLRIAGDHYAPFMEAHEEVVAAEVAFLQRHLDVRPRATVATSERDR